ncbi:hypothetical protein BH23CHL2_BH23CHL2_34360 [soil metagenome]
MHVIPNPFGYAQGRLRLREERDPILRRITEQVLLRCFAQCCIPRL